MLQISLTNKGRVLGVAVIGNFSPKVAQNITFSIIWNSGENLEILQNDIEFIFKCLANIFEWIIVFD